MGDGECIRLHLQRKDFEHGTYLIKSTHVDIGIAPSQQDHYHHLHPNIRIIHTIHTIHIIDSVVIVGLVAIAKI